MNTTAIIIAGISGIALGLLAYRILRNWSIAIAIPLLVVAGAAVLIPEKKLPLETSPTVAVDPNLPDDSGKSVADSAETAPTVNNRANELMPLPSVNVRATLSPPHTRTQVRR